MDTKKYCKEKKQTHNTCGVMHYKNRRKFEKTSEDNWLMADDFKKIDSKLKSAGIIKKRNGQLRRYRS